MTVIVFTQPNCQPCVAVKRVLSRDGIEFEERNAGDHIEFLASIGARSAPVIVAGDKIIHGFDPAQLKTLLD